MKKNHNIFAVLFLLVALFFLNLNIAFAYEPNDAFINSQWYLQKINAYDAWDIAANNKEIVIAIIDSGVQVNHPDLINNIWTNKKEIPNNRKDDDNNGYIDDEHGWDFIAGSNDPNPKFEIGYIEDEIAHGTIIAGLAAAVQDNRIGISGIAPNAKIMPLLVLDSHGAGSIESVVKAIDYAIDNHADIINLSFAGYTYSSRLALAVRRAGDAGVLIVAAAGNSSESEIGTDLNQSAMYPICNDGFLGENHVLGVAASDSLDQKATFSGFGSDCVDITAPGISIFSTSLYSPRIKNSKLVLDKYYDGYWSGTSMATALVSGTAALVMATNPSLSLEELIQIIQASSDYIEKLNPEVLGQLGTGRLNVRRAVQMAKSKLNNEFIITAPGSDGNGKIQITDKKGNIKTEIDVFSGFSGGINIASGDIDGDNIDEIIVGGAVGGGPQIQIYSSTGKLINQFFAYNKNFRGGVNIAIGDVNDDGIDDIVTGAGVGGGPHVRSFNKNGELLGQFFAYNKNFKGGVSVSVGDTDADGRNEIITGAGAGGGPQVRIFTRSGRVLSQFFAYNKDFRGGINVQVSDIDGGLKKYNEIVVSPISKGGPHIRIFDANANLLSDFYAYNKDYRGGVSIALGDIDNDGQKEIVTSPSVGGTSHVRMFELNGDLIGAFFAYENSFLGGVNLSTINIK